MTFQVWFWDSCGFTRYVQFTSFSDDFGAIGVTKKAIPQTGTFFLQCNSYQCIILEMHFYLIYRMYQNLVDECNRQNHDL